MVQLKMVYNCVKTLLENRSFRKKIVNHLLITIFELPNLERKKNTFQLKHKNTKMI